MTEDIGIEETTTAYKNKPTTILKHPNKKWVAKSDTFELFDKVKEIAGVFNEKRSILLYDQQGKANEIMEELHYQLVPWHQNDFTTRYWEVPPIIRDEVVRTIQTSQNARAVGPDEIPSKIYKLLNDSNALDAINSFSNVSYNSKHIPHSWPNSVFFALPTEDFFKGDKPSY